MPGPFPNPIHNAQEGTKHMTKVTTSPVADHDATLGPEESAQRHEYNNHPYLAAICRLPVWKARDLLITYSVFHREEFLEQLPPELRPGSDVATPAQAPAPSQRKTREGLKMAVFVLLAIAAAVSLTFTYSELIGAGS